MLLRTLFSRLLKRYSKIVVLLKNGAVLLIYTGAPLAQGRKEDKIT